MPVISSHVIGNFAMPAKCHCFQLDGFCKQELVYSQAGALGLPAVTIADRGPPPRRPVAISRAVGAGIWHQSADDVQQVQRALNHILPDVGGAIPFLNANGVIDGKTIAAIERFQSVNFGWKDGRVDPGLNTIKRMEEILTKQPATATGGIAPQRVSYAVSRLRVAGQCIRAAATNLALATSFVATGSPAPGPINSPSAGTLDLLERHFKVSQLQDRLAQLRRLRDTYQNMLSVIEQSVPTTPTNEDNLFNEFLGGSVFEFDPHPAETLPTTLAYTALNGWRRAGDTVSSPPVPANKIYLCALLDVCSDALFVEAIIHELAHFVSDTAQEIRDYGYGWINDPRMTVLPARKRVENAQNFTTYAIESKFGRRNGRLPI
jgi:peptidoglycan hydrolase-like protein with peptidoglycan-binding domain